jgi:hypothetical protein
MPRPKVNVSQADNAINTALHFLRTQILSTAPGKGLRSQKSKKNLLIAVAALTGQSKQRRLVIDFYLRCQAISNEAFILMSASYSPDTLIRLGLAATKRLIVLVTDNRDILLRNPILTDLANLCLSGAAG